MRLPKYSRTRTIGLLRYFLRVAVAVGRIPCPAAMATPGSGGPRRPAYATERSAMFICDVEHTLAELQPEEQRLLAICILEDRSEWEAGRALGLGQAQVSRRLGACLDRLHATFVRRGILSPLPVGELEEECND